MITQYLIISLVLAAGALAQDARPPIPELVTVAGEHYKNVVVNSVTTDTVSITHSVGVLTLRWSDIPDAAKARLGYDAQKFARAKEQHRAQANASAAAVPQLQLTGTAAQYKAQLERKLASTPVSLVTDIAAARQFLSTTQQLVPSLNKHAQLTMEKWSEVARQLAGSGLSDAGVERVFLKQFSQEDTRNNVQVLESTRALKDQLLTSKVPGTERVTLAVMSLFSAYASLCERDRTPSADPADFIRDLRTQYEFFAVAIIVFADQLKAFVEKVPDPSPHP